ncbi:hypothetical protein [Herbiconiux sp. A18JL235]|uniref:Uncharacterized protein n=1 Tax=Herbiconiux sp. A18JL235 TaxID=3152363 RepID=A0AB39BM94_9MICO
MSSAGTTPAEAATQADGPVVVRVGQTDAPETPETAVTPAVMPLALLGPAGASCEGDSCSF